MTMNFQTKTNMVKMKLYNLTTTTKKLDVAIDYTYPQKSSWSSFARIDWGYKKKLWEIVPISIVFAQQKATSLANFWLLKKKYRSCDLFSFLLLLPVLGPHLCYFLARFSRIKIEVKFSSNLNAISARMLLLYCFYLVKWEEK